MCMNFERENDGAKHCILIQFSLYFKYTYIFIIYAVSVICSL